MSQTNNVSAQGKKATAQLNSTYKYNTTAGDGINNYKRASALSKMIKER